MKLNPQHYIHRETSWLEFNQRVLEHALDARQPLLERLKFLTITASNFDEFFMVRVGGIKLMAAAGRKRRDPSGLTPNGQLRAIGQRAHEMVESQYACYNEQLEPLLREAGIRRLQWEDLSMPQESFLKRLFEEELFPLITPMLIDRPEVLPLLHNLKQHLLIRLENPGDLDVDRYAALPLTNLQRIVMLPADSGMEYILIEDVIRAFKERWFTGKNVLEAVPFRITRNADMSVREDQAPDLMTGMEDVLEERKVSGCVRLEVQRDVSQTALRFLRERLGLSLRDVYRIDGPLNLGDYSQLAFADGFEELKDEPWPPQSSPDIDLRAPVCETLAEKSVLLCHPYDSYDPVVRFVEEAADDPDVLAIKQILYRTSSRSPIIAALQRAAENGKTVTVIVELKARFDEARNIEWARTLEQAGVQVIYGVQGLKTHAKICIVIRRESGGIAKYVHFGTGNYNEKTARIYSDISYMTSDPDLGADATAFFNAISGYSEPPAFLKLRMAPIGIRDAMIDQIDSEIERRRQGQKAHIMAKMNSLVDTKIINKLYEASRAGVEIDLNIRGICCLRPGVKGLSENIRVISIVDRFLEHARIYYFHQGGDPQIFISSADWMQRNLDKRVELLTPVDDKTCRKRLAHILTTYFKDNASAWTLNADGAFTRLKPKSGKAFRSQEVLYTQAVQALEQARQAGRLKFKPHRADEKP